MNNSSLITLKCFSSLFLFSKIKSISIRCCSILFLASVLVSCKPDKVSEQKKIIHHEKSISPKNRIIMAVFAHPDDELFIGPMLSKYAREGATVQLVTVTDGRYGTGTTNLKPGEELVRLRVKEIDSATASLGIEKPILLGYHDQLKLKEGFFGHVPYAQDIMRDLDSLVTLIQPDVLITFGPDGVSNHMDHRLIGASISQVYLSKNWAKTKSLYYVATPSSHIDDPDQKILRGVDDSFLSMQIPYTELDVENTIKAMNYYKSQFSQETMDKRSENIRSKEKIIYLRPLIKNASISKNIFKP